MKKALIIFGVSAVTAVVTKVVNSNVKRQKEEKGKFEFKGLFEKAAAKQAAKDSVEAVKGISKEALSLIGLKALVEIFKFNRNAFNKIAIECGVVCLALGIFRTSWEIDEYKKVFDEKKRLYIPALILDSLLNTVHYLSTSMVGAGIGWLIVCFKHKSFDSWISKIILETIIGSIVGNLLLMFLPSTSKEVA